MQAKQVDYCLLIENSFGPIVGASVTFENGFVPSSRDYRVRVHTNEAGTNYINFAIGFDAEDMVYDPEGKWVSIGLVPEEYIKSGHDVMQEDDYKSLCNDLILLAREHGWKLLGDKEKASPDIQNFFL